LADSRAALAGALNAGTTAITDSHLIQIREFNPAAGQRRNVIVFIGDGPSNSGEHTWGLNPSNPLQTQWPGYRFGDDRHSGLGDYALLDRQTEFRIDRALEDQHGAFDSRLPGPLVDLDLNGLVGSLCLVVVLEFVAKFVGPAADAGILGGRIAGGPAQHGHTQGILV